MKTTLKSAIVAALAITMLGTSCTKNEDNTPMPTPTVTGLKISTNAQFGAIITDNLDHSVYFFSRDAGTVSNCTGQCAVVWPPFYKENPTLGTGLAATDFGVITRADGTKQTTYKGWPLYYYQQDAAAGDVKGDAIGKLWAVAKADYTVMFANAQLVGHDGLQYNDLGVAATVSSEYLTDPYGRTLYTFKPDTKNTNTFTKPDLSNNAIWPINEVTGVVSIPSVFDKTLFATITVAGKTQLVYKGRPLYQFGQDAGVRGNTKGVSFPTAGAGVWKVANNTTVAL